MAPAVPSATPAVSAGCQCLQRGGYEITHCEEELHSPNRPLSGVCRGSYYVLGLVLDAGTTVVTNHGRQKPLPSFLLGETGNKQRVWRAKIEQRKGGLAFPRFGGGWAVCILKK